MPALHTPRQDPALAGRDALHSTGLPRTVARIVTISGEVATGTSSLAEAFVRRHPEWRLAKTGDRFREYCAQRGISIQDVGNLPDEIHRAFDDEQRLLLEREHRLVVEGRLTGWLARDLSGVFKVLCYAPMAVRVDRYAAREHVSKTKSLADIRHRDQGDREKYRRVYGVDDYRAQGFYDLRLNTAHHNPDELAEILAASAGITPP